LCAELGVGENGVPLFVSHPRRLHLLQRLRPLPNEGPVGSFPRFLPFWWHGGNKIYWWSRSDIDKYGGRMGEMRGEAGEGMKWEGKTNKAGGKKI
jgi:hypothetical protein